VGANVAGCRSGGARIGDVSEVVSHLREDRWRLRARSFCFVLFLTDGKAQAEVPLSLFRQVGLVDYDRVDVRHRRVALVHRALRRDKRIDELFEVVIILLILSDINVTQARSLLTAYDSMGVRVPPSDTICHATYAMSNPLLHSACATEGQFLFVSPGRRRHVCLRTRKLQCVRYEHDVDVAGLKNLLCVVIYKYRKGKQRISV
jgi:hypothetical protein